MPGSETPERLVKINRERALYRLVLGMPDQTDLLQLLASRDHWDQTTVERAFLDLSAWGRQNGAADPDEGVR